MLRTLTSKIRHSETDMIKILQTYASWSTSNVNKIFKQILYYFTQK